MARSSLQSWLRCYRYVWTSVHSGDSWKWSAQGALGSIWSWPDSFKRRRTRGGDGRRPSRRKRNSRSCRCPRLHNCFVGDIQRTAEDFACVCSFILPPFSWRLARVFVQSSKTLRSASWLCVAQGRRLKLLQLKVNFLLCAGLTSANVYLVINVLRWIWSGKSKCPEYTILDTHCPQRPKIITFKCKICI